MSVYVLISKNQSFISFLDIKKSILLNELFDEKSFVLTLYPMVVGLVSPFKRREDFLKRAI